MNWMDDAFCQHFPSLPWISEPEDRTAACEQAMAVVCSACPVFIECLTYAQDGEVTSGFWAGHDRTPDASEDRSGAA